MDVSTEQTDSLEGRRQRAEAAVALVSRWLEESSRLRPDAAARRLATVLKDPKGLAFTVGFVDGVIRPEDPAVAAHQLRQVARLAPASLPRWQRWALLLAAQVAPRAPHLVIPVVRRVVRSMVGHLLIDASARALGRALGRLRRRDIAINVNLLGEAVLGEREAASRLSRVATLLKRPDVDYVSIKVSAIIAPHSPWAFDETVPEIVERLRPLFRQAAASPSPKFINLDMEEYRDLDLTVAVFTTLLADPALIDLEAGIVLQAYLPDSLLAMIRLQEWADARRRGGGAPIKVRLVKGANLPMEKVESRLRGWPLATWSSKQETDTHYKRVLHFALQPHHVESVRIGLASHNLFDIAYAWLLAGERGVRDALEFEMLLGMAPTQAEVVRREVGNLRLYTPVVHPAEFDVAIAYLIRRLDEAASQDNFMSAVFELHTDQALFARERDRFLASVKALDETVPEPRRTQRRDLAPPPWDNSEFANAADTDPSVPGNREWARGVLARVPRSTSGIATRDAHTLTTWEQLDAALGAAVDHSTAWGARSGADRATVLDAVADALEERRGLLLEVMAAETGKTIDQGDPEVSEAIDFARYYATLARELDHVDGAEFIPSKVTVITPPWNFPIAIPAGSVLAALAAGSAVVLKPAPQAARCGSVLAEVLWDAGVPREVLALVMVEESDLGKRLIADPRVDRVILTGSYETAALFRSFRPDVPLLAETSGKNAMVITPSADVDLAVKDLVASAFGHAGQKCSAASLVILVGNLASSRRFHAQLLDAAQSLVVGPPQVATSEMGPLVEAPGPKLLAGLTELGPGESWLLKPAQLDESGQLWSPGIRTGVRRGSHAHLTEFFGPVLSIMYAATLSEAIAIQNDVDYGLTAGLHSRDRHEISLWLDRVQAGNLYVNRGITGAIVRRQPFGGWKRSAVGAGTKAGGPNYLIGLGDWRPTSPLESENLMEVMAADADAWERHFGVLSDVSDLGCERNVLRYRPVSVLIRLGAEGTVTDLLRVVSAARTAGSEVTISTARALPPDVKQRLAEFGLAVRLEVGHGWAVDSALPSRVRLIGEDPAHLIAATDARPDLAIYAQRVTASPRVELLPFLHEQAISITAHRFGSPDPLAHQVL